jgi:hypothetical protein
MPRPSRNALRKRCAAACCPEGGATAVTQANDNATRLRLPFDFGDRIILDDTSSRSVETVSACKILQARRLRDFGVVTSQFNRSSPCTSSRSPFVNSAKHLGLLSEMYRLRRRLFKDRLDWSVSVSGGLELDVYDALNPTYLIALNDNLVIGCVRLLPNRLHLAGRPQMSTRPGRVSHCRSSVQGSFANRNHIANMIDRPRLE